jgi:hypothetical protein
MVVVRCCERIDLSSMCDDQIQNLVAGDILLIKLSKLRELK